jgi:hypothetical protein
MTDQLIDITKPIETVPTEWQGAILCKIIHQDRRGYLQVLLLEPFTITDGGKLYDPDTEWYFNNNGALSGFEGLDYVAIRNVPEVYDNYIEHATFDETIELRKWESDILRAEQQHEYATLQIAIIHDEVKARAKLAKLEST